MEKVIKKGCFYAVGLFCIMFGAQLLGASLRPVACSHFYASAICSPEIQYNVVALLVAILGLFGWFLVEVGTYGPYLRADRDVMSFPSMFLFLTVGIGLIVKLLVDFHILI